MKAMGKALVEGRVFLLGRVYFVALILIGATLCSGCATLGAQRGVPLFPTDGPPQGWLVRDWADVANPAVDGAAWQVKDGVLHGSTPRGTWLISEKTYRDFTLRFEFKLGERGNSGCGLRFPLHGDPAFDGLEFQLVDPRYYGDYQAPPAELAGALYKGLAPRVDAFRPEAWNVVEITCRGKQVRAHMNGQLLYDADLESLTAKLERGTPLSERPLEGHIGFQELSRGGGHVEIRNAFIEEY